MKIKTIRKNSKLFSVTSMMLASFDWQQIPDLSGVYFVLHDFKNTPVFIDPGTGPMEYKGKKVNVGVDVLDNKWVENDSVIYIGKTEGRNGLRKRIKEYIRFGLGKKANHYGGRYIWQIADLSRLSFQFIVTDQADEKETELIDEFFCVHRKLPFANLVRPRYEKKRT